MATPNATATKITLTHNAVQKVRSMLDSSPQNAGKSLRLFAEGSCCNKEYGLVLDNLQPGDWECRCDGVSVIVDSESSSEFEDCVVDYIQDGADAGFTISMANRPASCGCCQ
jgi:iron-sulfur cluster assembly accessory protein